MGYRAGQNIPDYAWLSFSLKEILEGVLEQLEEDDRNGIGPDVSFLEAADNLKQQLDALWRDLGL